MPFWPQFLLFYSGWVHFCWSCFLDLDSSCSIDCKCIPHIFFHFKQLLTFVILIFGIQNVSHLISFSLSYYFCNTFQYVYYFLFSNISDVLTDLVPHIKHCTTYSPEVQSIYPWIHILSCFILFVFYVIFSILFVIDNSDFISTFNHPGNLISCVVQKPEKIKQCIWILCGLLLQVFHSSRCRHST